MLARFRGEEPPRVDSAGNRDGLAPIALLEVRFPRGEHENGLVGGEDAEGVGVGTQEDVSAIAIVVALEERGDLVDVASLHVIVEHKNTHRRPWRRRP